MFQMSGSWTRLIFLTLRLVNTKYLKGSYATNFKSQARWTTCRPLIAQSLTGLLIWILKESYRYICKNINERVGWWERAVGVAGERPVNVRGGMSAHWPHYLNWLREHTALTHHTPAVMALQVSSTLHTVFLIQFFINIIFCVYNSLQVLYHYH